MKKLMILLLILMASVGVTLANGVDDRGVPNDPDVNERANACYEGASMSDAPCDTDWEWTCGWYLIRWETDNSYPMPAGCNSLLPQMISVPPVVGLPDVTGPAACSLSIPDSTITQDLVAHTETVAIVTFPFFSICGDMLTASVSVINASDAFPYTYICLASGSPYEVRVTWTAASGSYDVIYNGNCVSPG